MAAFCYTRDWREKRGLFDQQLQALVDEALADLLEKRRLGRPSAHVMAAYQASHEKFGPLYKKLAE